MSNSTYKKIISLITYAALLIFFLVYINSFLNIIGTIIRVLKPLWTGLLLAFVLNVPMSAIEKSIFGATNKKIRVVSLIMSILIIVLLFTVVFAWVIPDFIDSLTYMLKEVPNIVHNFYDLLINLFKNTDYAPYLQKLSSSDSVTNVLSKIFSSLINNSTGILSNSAGVLFNLITGIIIAVYFLFGKEHMIQSTKNILHKFLDENLYNKIISLGKMVNKFFHDFIAYQCLECLILGSLMFIAFEIFRFPYAVTIAFLTTITAIIPIFGATIALIIGAVLIGTKSLGQAVVFIIVFQVIQQIENNFIYPHIVGKKVGLPPILTILAVAIGAKLGGVFGMIVCIPLTGVLNTLFWSLMEKDIPKISLPSAKKAKVTKKE